MEAEDQADLLVDAVEARILLTCASRASACIGLEAAREEGAAESAAAMVEAVGSGCRQRSNSVGLLPPALSRLMQASLPLMSRRGRRETRADHGGARERRGPLTALGLLRLRFGILGHLNLRLRLSRRECGIFKRSSKRARPRLGRAAKSGKSRFDASVQPWG